METASAIKKGVMISSPLTHVWPENVFARILAVLLAKVWSVARRLSKEHVWNVETVILRAVTTQKPVFSTPAFALIFSARMDSFVAGNSVLSPGVLNVEKNSTVESSKFGTMKELSNAEMNSAKPWIRTSSVPQRMPMEFALAWTTDAQTTPSVMRKPLTEFVTPQLSVKSMEIVLPDSSVWTTPACVM